MRTVESVYRSGEAAGRTNIFIYPGFQFKAVSAMLTNFHLPQSSLLMLVCAFAGREFALARLTFMPSRIVTVSSPMETAC